MGEMEELLKMNLEEFIKAYRVCGICIDDVYPLVDAGQFEKVRHVITEYKNGCINSIDELIALKEARLYYNKNLLQPKQQPKQE